MRLIAQRHLDTQLEELGIELETFRFPANPLYLQIYMPPIYMSFNRNGHDKHYSLCMLPCKMNDLNCDRFAFKDS